MNAFERLGLELRLVMTAEEIGEAFRKRAAEAHPDSGGSEADFGALREARDLLLSPSGRLRAWMRARGEEADARGTIGGELMDLFQKVAETGAGAEAAIKAGADAKSALAKGMAEVRLIAEREKVKALLAEIEGGIAEREGLFPGIEAGEAHAAETMRDLVFLEKWRFAMRSLYGRLI